MNFDVGSNYIAFLLTFCEQAQLGLVTEINQYTTKLQRNRNAQATHCQ